MKEGNKIERYKVVNFWKKRFFSFIRSFSIKLLIRQSRNVTITTFWKSVPAKNKDGNEITPEINKTKSHIIFCTGILCNTGSKNEQR